MDPPVEDEDVVMDEIVVGVVVSWGMCLTVIIGLCNPWIRIILFPVVVQEETIFPMEKVDDSVAMNEDED
jgi:hypothetical protein